MKRSLPVASATGISAAAPRLPSTGPASPTRASASRVVAERLRPDHGAHERDEHGGRGLDALAAQLEHVAHLVHEDQQPRSRPRTSIPRSASRPRPTRASTPTCVKILIFGSRNSSAFSFAAELRGQQADRAERREQPAPVDPLGPSRDGSAPRARAGACRVAALWSPSLQSLESSLAMGRPDAGIRSGLVLRLASVSGDGTY